MLLHSWYTAPMCGARWKPSQLAHCSAACHRQLACFPCAASTCALPTAAVMLLPAKLCIASTRGCLLHAGTTTTGAYQRSNYRWTDGTPLLSTSYQNWATNQPNFGTVFGASASRNYCVLATWRFKNAAAGGAYQWFSNDCQNDAGGSYYPRHFPFCKTLREGCCYLQPLLLWPWLSAVLAV